VLKSKFIWHEEEWAAYESVGSGVNPEIERLFLARGLGTIDALKKDALVGEVWHDPFKFKDMNIAINRIKQAIVAQAPILVYGDYDADGTTSTALLLRVLRQLGADANFYIPHRFFEGYGPNEEAFMQAVNEGYQLIITVDCGISGVAEAQLLKDHQVDLIIIDHHHLKAKVPHAMAIIHPEYDAAYPFDYLAGAGVTLKVVEALKDGQLEADDYVLAMLGTVGDVVVLIDENRTIVKRGLAALRKTTLPGLLALLRVGEVIQDEADETTVGFVICPRLNAPGRMDDASIVVALLLVEETEMAMMYAKEIDAMNQERKAITNQITEAAIQLTEEKEVDELKALVVHDPSWHEGVLGIVASRMVEKYGKAVVVLTDSEEGLMKGSARAPAGLNLLHALTDNEALLAKYGGHEGAAGMTLAIDDPNLLEAGLNRTLAKSTARNGLTVDMHVPLAELDLNWLDELACLAPFGQGNQKPIVKLSGVTIQQVKRIGATHDHLKFTMHQNEHAIDAIFFGGASIFIYLTQGARFDVLCDIERNEWNGHQKLQARIIDMKCDEVQLLDLRNQKLDEAYAPFIKDGFVIDTIFDSKALLKSAYAASGFKNVVLKRLPVMTMPSRLQFVFVYQTAKTYAPFRLTPDILVFFEKEGISKGMLIFIMRVFTEVGLMSYDEGILKLNETTEKVDFKTAPAYMARATKVAVYEFLELATTDEMLEFITG